MNDSHLFAASRECMKHADYTGGSNARIGCIVVYKGSILAKGYNTNRTHTYQARFNKIRYKENGNNYLPEKMHAEISVLQRIKYLDIDFSRVHLYIYRELKNGHIALAKPCPACMAAIKQMGIKHIHYTSYDGFVYEKLVLRREK